MVVVVTVKTVDLAGVAMSTENDLRSADVITKLNN
jgi:hypothetical protein